jgi:hypothetical protein
MAISTATVPGQILTSAYVNNNINSGLTYITGGSLSSTATNFAGCFSATYDNYRIVVSSPALSASGDIYIKYLVTGTTPTADNAYFWALRGYTSGGAASDNSGSAQALSYTGWSTSAAGGSGGISFDVYTPFLSTQNTLGTSSASSFGANYVGRQGLLGYGTVTSLTGIQFLTNAAPTMTGNVQIYGYRKA